ncbi:MAG: L-serine ammonia-lyase [Desulfobacula sp.]|jgi:L-serine dehydratase|uniref:L-serine ammonia-lyase n=1 Tax=Desulfobacula sp. TaxID=2593537 RepID=UPI001DFE868A|nr:L-serine ammonia-lyase [Desulfobacula sp.]MBT3485601.1 L-serine ammonia-lyase [Desulfobacula sp.]MBT3807740.1 L-serine ammonia-lyase [Desulfobacula sp.]MBT4027457.1 L-serine ammonia-lyase [Desulfobacula sp.]MBT4197819.1 L-serine ammonia-lyase [Desulfobacula sp.]
MKSIRKIFRIGTGPSSSHTMGPEKAARIFKKRYPRASGYKVFLYGSLAATGKGHLTDEAIKKILGEQLEIIWEPMKELPFHPNGLKFYALNDSGSGFGKATFYSTGGGAITEEGATISGNTVYSLNSLEAILYHCKMQNLALYEYGYQCEGKSVRSYLEKVWKTMRHAIDTGLEKEGYLPGKLKLKRKAKTIFLYTKKTDSLFSANELISAYALSVSEENAGGGVIVTAPTCGSCGVLPAVLRYLQIVLKCDDRVILDALVTAGLIGNIVKHNASISGAEAGCQAEIGTACAMAAAAAAQILGGNLNQIEYAAEIGMEHHLGLTCDPIYGLVQVPCIERNAFAANRALTSARYSIALGGEHYVSFDDVVQVMSETGDHMSPFYKETSTGGLAKIYQNKKHPHK